MKCNNILDDNLQFSAKSTKDLPKNKLDSHDNKVSLDITNRKHSESFINNKELKPSRSKLIFNFNNQGTPLKKNDNCINKLTKIPHDELIKSASTIRFNNSKHTNNSVSSGLLIKDKIKSNETSASNLKDKKFFNKSENNNKLKGNILHKLSTSKSQKRVFIPKGEVAINTNSLIYDTIKRIPNLKKTLEKNLKRPMSVNAMYK